MSVFGDIATEHMGEKIISFANKKSKVAKEIAGKHDTSDSERNHCLGIMSAYDEIVVFCKQIM